MNEALFELIMRKEPGKRFRERLFVRKRNIYIDLVELFAYVVYGKFVKGVHRLPHGPGGSWCFRPGIQSHNLFPLINFFLKSFLRGYRYTSFMFP